MFGIGIKSGSSAEVRERPYNFNRTSRAPLVGAYPDSENFAFSRPDFFLSEPDLVQSYWKKVYKRLNIVALWRSLETKTK